MLSFHHPDSLRPGPKPLDFTNVSFAIFLISCVILAHISFALTCGCMTPPSKILCWKIICFSSFKCHHLIRGSPLWLLRSSLNNYIYNQYFMLVSQALFMYDFTIQPKFYVQFSNKK
ncbi:transmembrane protein, putative [Medicago truncatula]|uniref:Transmembrane protein, putative n=1 Tax=Medicago truncatula TaxID=3880 RepID=A0A072UNZ4_MEDTR|nr:transmembrane protein, putative [Medicago truncatula]